MSELQQVLAALDAAYAWSVETGKGGRPSTEAMHDAARVIRELSAEVEQLKQELAEATASRDRLQQVVEAFGDGGEKGPSVWAFIDEWPTLKEKAKALDDLEAWLRETAPRYTEVAFSFACGFQVIPAGTAANGRLGETLVAAIRDALERARASGQGGK